MSGRRRRDDGWDDAQDGRDMWADDSIGEWGGRDADIADGGNRSRQPSASSSGSGGGTGAYGRGGQSYAAPDVPTFQAAGGSSSSYGRSSGDRGQRTAAGYASGAYSPDAGYGGSQSAGYGRGGSGGGGGRREAAGYDAGYGGGPSAPSGARGGANGYGGRSASANGGGYGRSGFSPEFMPVEDDDPDDAGSAGMPRPYGRLSIYTLREDMTREFDRIAERAAEGVRTSEPDTLVYVIHVVPKAPQQRIIYEIYRDRAAFMSHERQPHIRQFGVDRASCVLATNIIDLRLKYAKVAALGGPADSAPASAGPAQGQGQQGRSQRPEPAAAQGIQYTPTSYTPTPQYSASQPQGKAASFTPAGSASGQGYSQLPQYRNAGAGAYGVGNGQYDAANSNGYSGAAGYPNGASYSGNGYPSSNAYPVSNGYSGANGYQSPGGYSDANGYANGTNSYKGANGYANGANGYGAGSGYSNDASAGYGATGGYPDSGSGSYSAASAQYTPRYRELTSGGGPADAGTAGYGQQTPEWDQRSQGYRR